MGAGAGFGRPLPLSWRGLSVVISGKTILHPCAGRVPAGRCCAVMGPSGSGKTTLLHTLSRRRQKTTGVVRYGGEQWSKALRHRVAYVDQEDVVMPELTVRETLVYTSRLRLPARTMEQRARAMQRVAELLRLLGCGRRALLSYGAVGAF